MRRILLAAIILLPWQSGCGGDERIYDFKGHVVAVDAGGKTVTIDHEDIPGLMRAMKMPFSADDPALLEGLVAGMPVEGRMRVVSGRYVLLELKRKGGPIGPEREIQDSLSKLVPQDRKRVEQQGYCPVSDKPLGTMGLPVKLIFKGEPVYLCCESCRKKAEEDADGMLKKAGELRKK